MPVYKYTGFNSEGKKVYGTVEGNSVNFVISKLKEQGIFVESIKDVKSKDRFLILDYFKGFVSSGRKLLPDVFFQLAMLLKSGIPLSESLKITGNQVNNKKVKNILLALSAKVSEGVKLSVAMQEFNDYFSDVLINLVRTSEETGRLAETFENVARYEEEKRKSMDKIKVAMIYPMIVLSIGMGVVGFLLSYVVPKMKNIFSAVNRELPATTKFLIATGNFIKSYGVLAITILIILIILIRVYLKKNEKILKKIDKYLLRFNLFLNINLYKFSESMNFLLSEGVPLLTAVSLSTNSISNRELKDVLFFVAEDIKSGKSFSESLKRSGSFPEMFVAAIKTGEKSGNLANIFLRLSEFYFKKIEKTLNVFLSIIEPLFILILGLIVGFIVLSIMSPLFELNTFIR